MSSNPFTVLEQQSMLYQAKQLAIKQQGLDTHWHHPYGLPGSLLDPEATIWLDVYPASIVTRPDQSIIQALANERLWPLLHALNIKVMHTNPLNKAGSIHNQQHLPSVDGGYDRIDYSVDPAFGSDADYRQLIRIATQYHCDIAADIIPAHTGKGIDFRLAECNYGEYPGLYHMIAIAEADWPLLPPVPVDQDSVNLSVSDLQHLQAKGYKLPLLPEVIFKQAGIKDTNWSATAEVAGADGKIHRWVYLHLFKAGQPCLNWLHPSFLAARLITGDLLKTRLDFGARYVRIDANAHLGIEGESIHQPQGILRGHALSHVSTGFIAMLMRQLGGVTYEENNSTLPQLKAAQQAGADLSYDFATRTGYIHALLTGNTGLLRLQLELTLSHQIDTRRLIHALQNHDALCYEMPHFTYYTNDLFHYNNEILSGQALNEHILAEVEQVTAQLHLPFSYAFGGISTTLTSLIAARLHINTASATPEQVALIQQVMLLAVLYNAMQPGVFQISGWDLVGALQLPIEQMQGWLQDGDLRWLNRGALDLTGEVPAEMAYSTTPITPHLFGDLTTQFAQPHSFVKQLQKLFHLRQRLGIAQGSLLNSLPIKNAGSLLLVSSLEERSWLLLALNFSHLSVHENFNTENITALPVTIAAELGSAFIERTTDDRFHITLPAFSGEVFLIQVSP